MTHIKQKDRAREELTKDTIYAHTYKKKMYLPSIYAQH